MTAYTFSITASLVQGSVTSDYAKTTTKGRGRLIKSVNAFLIGSIYFLECSRSLYRGTYYRGTTAVSDDGRPCLNWSELSTYSNLVALYPEAGLGNHSYCRNPISENRTRPWCYTNNTGGCLNWTYCDIDACEGRLTYCPKFYSLIWFFFFTFLDMKCYSTVDNGYGYRGSSTNGCVKWTRPQLTTFPVSQYAAAGLGDHNYCRNPDPKTRSKPWCYSANKDVQDCSVSMCTSGIVQLLF